jgi:lysyl-tRNA synthetase class 2
MAEQKLEEIRKIRLEKVEKLVELGINPYPSKAKGESVDVRQAREKMDQEVAVCGRVMSIRGQGNVNFFDLKDETGKIQLWFQKDLLKDTYKILELLDTGDILYAKGLVTKTKAGEISISVSDFQLLSKSIRPLPSTWFGLKDVEERYRKRYLDLLVNDGVKDRFEIRSKLVSAIRNMLNSKGFLEVETPTLQSIYGGGFAKPFITHHNALDSDYYLRISDEMYLKRLIVGGFEKVYEITKVFRNEGIDYDHNPEFTMFEAMIAYQDYNFGMDLIEEIVEQCVLKIIGKTKIEYQGQTLDFTRPWKRLKLVDAIKEYNNTDPLSWKTLEEAKKAASKLGIESDKLKSMEHMLKIGEVIAFVFEETVEHRLEQPTIIYDYPVEVSPLAKKCEDERFTQRFEMFAGGTEFGNNYSELNDPVDLNKRFIEEKKREKAGFDEAQQTDYDYITAIEYGFPPTCGIAIGIDRLVMLFTDAPSLKEVILFPTLRPEK